MQWIMEFRDVDATLGHMKECTLGEDRQADPRRTRLTFDCVEFHTRPFLSFLRQLMKWSGDDRCRYAVLDPDPVTYFFAHFRKYPVIEIAVDDSADSYIEALTQDPGGSPADAIGTNWFEYAILPPSGRWCIHGERDERSGEGGHLWLPMEWTEQAKEVYPFALH